MAATRPPLFFASVGMYGTLAAIRCLGERGVPVSMRAGPWRVPSSGSKYVSRTVPGPRQRSLTGHLGYLRAFGRENLGQAMIPGGDESLWVAATHREELGQYFRLSMPGGEAVYTLLNKRRLGEVAVAAGLRVPRAWFPVDPAGVREVASSATRPVVLKPRTHVGYRQWQKGVVVRDASRLESEYATFGSKLRFDQSVRDHDPEVDLPMVQVYLPEARRTIYNLTGYITQDARLAAFRATRKVLQYPRTIGVGLCFEAAPVEHELRDRVREMCKGVGFHGMFEAEFIPVDGEFLLIDFNPRVFNSIGLDIARGCPLPWFAYLEAIGDLAALEEALAAANAPGAEGTVDAWGHRLLFELMLAGQLAGRGMGWREARAWQRWWRGRRIQPAVSDRSDPWPARRDAAAQLLNLVTNPRSAAGTFLRH